MKGTVEVLAIDYSVRSPFFIKFGSKKDPEEDRPFRFEVSWIDHQLRCWESLVEGEPGITKDLS